MSGEGNHREVPARDPVCQTGSREATLRVERRTPVAAMTALGVSFTLLIAAWVVATPPFTAPDEASHYLRALSIANGHLVGPKVAYRPVPPGTSPAQLAWADKGTRAVRVPAPLSPPDVTCMNGRPDVAAQDCLEATEVGNYHPLPYLLPALALTVSHDAATGLWLSRLASALPCLAFILLAFIMLWDASAWSLVGALGAITPMVLFVSSVVNPNGLQLAACLAFAASVLRIVRAPSHQPTWVWAAFAASGAVAILAWQLGPVFVVADLLLGAALLGFSGLGELRCSGRRFGLSALTLVMAAALYLVYGLASGVSHSTFGLSPIGSSLHAGLSQLGPVLRDSVGTFGSLTVRLPSSAYWIWWLGITATITGAMWVGSRRDRWLLGAVVVIVLTFPVLFFAWVYRFTGFGLQGRYVLPMIVLIPLLAGEIIRRRLQMRPPHQLWRFVPGAAAALVACFQAYAWWFNARVAAGAPHSVRFYVHPSWSPPLGWWPWIAITALGAAALFTFGVIGTSSPARYPSIANQS
ncbi:MAG: DUF2142 domain-containing protein [Solirubrobacteraceae bacterium]